MTSDRNDLVFRRFERPDEVLHMRDSRFEIVRLSGLTIGRAIY